MADGHVPRYSVYYSTSSEETHTITLLQYSMDQTQVISSKNREPRHSYRQGTDPSTADCPIIIVRGRLSAIFIGSI